MRLPGGQAPELIRPPAEALFSPSMTMPQAGERTRLQAGRTRRPSLQERNLPSGAGPVCDLSHRRHRSLKSNWLPWLGALLILANPVLAGGNPATDPRPSPLPAIELPPPAAGAPQARQADELAGKGDYEGALLLYRYAWTMGLNSPDSTYNGACAAAMTGRMDEAFTWLGRAVAAGWGDAAHLQVDTDLDALRDDPRFAAFVKKVEANGRRYDEENNAELRQLMAKDQAARQDVPSLKEVSREEFAAFWKRVSADDAARRARVAEILAAGGARTGEDYFAAALVYQHGQELDDFARAREYAAKAVQLGNERGRWLAAAAWDRWLVNAGYPQRFGTQYMCDPDCRLQAWDETMTDGERARWNVPPLAVAKTMMSNK